MQPASSTHEHGNSAYHCIDKICMRNLHFVWKCMDGCYHSACGDRCVENFGFYHVVLWLGPSTHASTNSWISMTVDTGIVVCNWAASKGVCLYDLIPFSLLCNLIFAGLPVFPYPQCNFGTSSPIKCSPFPERFPLRSF